MQTFDTIGAGVARYESSERTVVERRDPLLGEVFDQRFRVEDDKLVVTVASRGVVPANLSGQNGGENGEGKTRRGWGLKLIKSLMDEVEFERVDDGTQLRMIKYRK